MSGVLIASSGTAGVRLNATLTIGDDAAGTYGFFAGSFGSLSPATYQGKTIDGITWNDTADVLVLELDGASVPNSAATFSALSVGGTPFQRTAAVYLADTGAGNTRWTWSSVAVNPIGTSGSQNILIS